MQIQFDDKIKFHFFGSYANDCSNFKFNDYERKTIYVLVDFMNSCNGSSTLTPSQVDEISEMSKKIGCWFESDEYNVASQKIIHAPAGSMNLLLKLNETGKKNALRPKQGYRYGTDLKRLAVLAELYRVR